MATGSHEGFDAGFALLVAGGFVRGGLAAEAEGFFVHDEIDVLGEALDEFPRFRERGAAFESKVFADVRQGEEFAQRPANPEVFLNAGGIQPHRGLNRFATELAVGEIQFQEGIHEADIG